MVLALLWSEYLDAGFLVVVWFLVAMGKFDHSDGFFSNLLVEALQCGLWLDELREEHVDIELDDQVNVLDVGLGFFKVQFDQFENVKTSDFDVL